MGNIFDTLKLREIEANQLSAITRSNPEEYAQEKSNFMSMLDIIFKCDNVEYLEDLTELGADWKNLFSLDSENQSFHAHFKILFCVDKNAHKCLKFLVENGVSMNVQSKDHASRNLLLYALGRASLECAQVLLTLDIDATQIDDMRQNALYLVLRPDPSSVERKYQYATHMFSFIFESVWDKMTNQIRFDNTCEANLLDKNRSDYLYDLSVNRKNVLDLLCEINFNFALPPTSYSSLTQNPQTWFGFLIPKLNFLELQQLDKHLLQERYDLMNSTDDRQLLKDTIVKTEREILKDSIAVPSTPNTQKPSLKI